MTIKSSTARPRKAAAKKAPADHRPSLREQLARKRAHVAIFRINPDEATDKLQADAAEAASTAKIATLTRTLDDGQKAKLQAEADRLQAEYEAACLEFRFRGLSPDEWDALLTAFAVPELTDEEKAEGKEREKYDLTGFTAHLLAASAEDSDLSADEWLDELQSGRWSKAEVEGMRAAATSATTGEPAASIPKG
jgi:hypothetical protein